MPPRTTMSGASPRRRCSTPIMWCRTCPTMPQTAEPWLADRHRACRWHSPPEGALSAYREGGPHPCRVVAGFVAADQDVPGLVEGQGELAGRPRLYLHGVCHAHPRVATMLHRHLRLGLGILIADDRLV